MKIQSVYNFLFKEYTFPAPEKARISKLFEKNIARYAEEFAGDLEATLAAKSNALEFIDKKWQEEKKRTGEFAKNVTDLEEQIKSYKVELAAIKDENGKLKRQVIELEEKFNQMTNLCETHERIEKDLDRRLADAQEMRDQFFEAAMFYENQSFFSRIFGKKYTYPDAESEGCDSDAQ